MGYNDMVEGSFLSTESAAHGWRVQAAFCGFLFIELQHLSYNQIITMKKP